MSYYCPAWIPYPCCPRNIEANLYTCTDHELNLIAIPTLYIPPWSICTQLFYMCTVLENFYRNQKDVGL